LTKSSDAGNFEFIVHVKNEYDYRFTSDARDELFEHIKACYFHMMNANLPVYMVPGKVKEYETSKKDVKAGLEKLPADSYQQRNEDIYEPLKPETPDGPLTIDDDDLPSQPGNHRASFAKNGDMDVTLSDFTIKKVIGRGSFGKVFLVQKKNTDEVFAMKSLRKDVIIEYDQVESTKLEKDILLQADHPFLVGMSYVFQTDQKIFFVMRFVRGGELFSHLRQVTRFPEDRAKFYAIQVAMALGHLHSKKIIYRDLKPENILMDEDGYICLTDFGLAKVLEGNAQAYSFCGTPDYLAPEILVERGHSFPVDWWALGILTYEMIVGFPPFYTGTQNNSKMYELIKKKAVYFPDQERHKIVMSENCKDFINRLLEKNA
jgi:serum/glucocorticoid-regulated kinase 2